MANASHIDGKICGEVSVFEIEMAFDFLTKEGSTKLHETTRKRAS